MTDDTGFACFCCVSVEKAQAPSLFEQKASAAVVEQQQPQLKVVYYRALYPFDARSHDEISIVPGDLIMVRNSAFTLTDAWVVSTKYNRTHPRLTVAAWKSGNSRHLKNTSLCQLKEPVGLFSVCFKQCVNKDLF